MSIGRVLQLGGLVKSRTQLKVETSTYRAELVAGRLATEMAIEFRYIYIFRMLGVPIDGPVILLGDNKGMIKNTLIMSLS